MEYVPAIAVEFCGIIRVGKDFQAEAAAEVIFHPDSTPSHLSKITYV